MPSMVNWHLLRVHAVWTIGPWTPCKVPVPEASKPGPLKPAHLPVSRRGLTPLGPSTPEAHSTHTTKQGSLVRPKCSCACVCQVYAVHAARHALSHKKHGMCQHALFFMLWDESTYVSTRTCSSCWGLVKNISPASTAASAGVGSKLGSGGSLILSTSCNHAGHTLVVGNVSINQLDLKLFWG